MARKTADSQGSTWPSLYGWIGAFLSEKTTPRKVIEWWAWARGRLDNGWHPEAIRQRIRDAWQEHVAAGAVSLAPMPIELLAELRDVYRMADDGEGPQSCAVVYRSLARKYPAHAHWLGEAARLWGELAPDWQPESVV